MPVCSLCKIKTPSTILIKATMQMSLLNNKLLLCYAFFLLTSHTKQHPTVKKTHFTNIANEAESVDESNVCCNFQVCMSHIQQVVHYLNITTNGTKPVWIALDR